MNKTDFKKYLKTFLSEKGIELDSVMKVNDKHIHFTWENFIDLASQLSEDDRIFIRDEIIQSDFRNEDVAKKLTMFADKILNELFPEY